jgi:hypothetical protein
MGDAATTMWPRYAPVAHGLGAGAVSAFPLQAGVVTLGALSVYRAEPGALSTPALARALTYASVAMHMVLDAHDDAVKTATRMIGVGNRFEVYQAQGIVMVQLGVGAAEAMSRMRAHAYARDRRLTDVAGDIVGRTLTLEPDNTAASS